MRSDLALYRRLLRLLPRGFRTRFGSEMEELFTYRMSRARTRAGRGWIWIRAVVDVAGHAVLERLRPAEELERGRKGTMGSAFDALALDLRYATRSVARSPLLTLAAATTFAMGIGASTATFSVVGTALWKDLPYREPERLLALWPATNFNVAMVREAVEAMPALEAASGLSGWSLTLVGEGPPLEVEANRVSANHFRVLGVEPALGRTFRDEEGLPGRGEVVVLSHGFWMRVFGADPGVIGRTLQMSGAEAETRTVIGVMPPDFRPLVGEPEAWIPLVSDPAATVASDDTWYVNHRVGRLAPGATLEEANEQVERFARSLGERMGGHFDQEAVEAAEVRPYAEHVAGEMASALLVALGAVSLVLLIACANVANLLLARGEARARDLAVRAALGADRGRVVRMMLAEAALLGALGGALGVAGAYGLVRAVVAFAPADFPRIAEVGVDGPVLAWAVAASVLATLLAGLVPALRASRVDATSSLGGGTRASSGRRGSRLARALVGLEVALAVVVAVGSGLMLRSLERLTSMDTGLEAEGVVAMRVVPPDGRYPEAAAYHAYYGTVLERLRALPQVASVGAIHLLPGTENNWNFPTWPEGVDVPEGTPRPVVNFRVTRPGYFATVGLRPLRGRLLEPTDDAGAEKVMVVNRTFVERFWPGLDPIGRTVRTLESKGEPYQVVGVVDDVRQHGFAREPEPEMYLNQPQWSWNVSLWLLVKVRGENALEHAAALQQAVWSVDPEVPITGTSELGDVFHRSAATTRFLAVVLGWFGALALVLGAVGVFGVTAYTVGRRVPEFGVRLALGSSRTRVLASALLTCGTPVAAGLVVGLVGAALASGALRSVLFEVEPSDPATLAGVATTLVVVAALASLLPAWRASRLDPSDVVRAE